MSWIKKIFRFFSTKEKDLFYVQIEKIVGGEISNISLYKLAFKHKSKNKENNERLEFLGDSILDSVISEIIYKNFPDKNEGELSKLRSKMVSRTMLNQLANHLDLLSLLSYRETHTHQGLRNSEGNALEALIGAIYLDQGYRACFKFVKEKLIKPYINWQKLEKEVVDHKSLLYTYCQKESKLPQFKMLAENMEDETKRFHIALKIDGEQVAEGYGKNKKVAEQKAAKAFLKSINSELL